MVHYPSVPAEQSCDSAIAITPLLGGIANDGLSQPYLVAPRPGTITLAPPGLAKDQTDAAFRHPQYLPDTLNAPSPTGRA